MSLRHRRATIAAKFCALLPEPLLVVILLVSSMFSVSGVAAAIPSDGTYEIQTPGVRGAPRFIIEHGELRHASGALHTPLCQLASDFMAQYPVTDLENFFTGNPGTQIIDRGDGHYLLTTGLVLNEHLQFQQIGTGAVAAIYAELDFTSEEEATLTLQAATPYFLGQGLDTTHCLARSKYRVKKVSS